MTRVQGGVDGLRKILEAHILAQGQLAISKTHSGPVPPVSVVVLVAYENVRMSGSQLFHYRLGRRSMCWDHNRITSKYDIDMKGQNIGRWTCSFAEWRSLRLFCGATGDS